MTIQGAIEEIKMLEVPFYAEPIKAKIIETIIDECRDYYYQGRTDAIDECIDELREEHESWVNRGRPEYALATRFCIEDLEQLKLTP